MVPHPELPPSPNPLNPRPFFTRCLPPEAPLSSYRWFACFPLAFHPLSSFFSSVHLAYILPLFPPLCFPQPFFLPPSRFESASLSLINFFPHPPDCFSSLHRSHTSPFIPNRSRRPDPVSPHFAPTLTFRHPPSSLSLECLRRPFPPVSGAPGYTLFLLA